MSDSLPGTTPVGTGPQAGQGTDNNNSGQPGGTRKIAGKFDSLEQAVEQGYTGLEKGFHAMREDVAKLTNLVERLATNDPSPGSYPGYAPVGTGGHAGGGYGGNQGYGTRFNPYHQPDPDYIDPTQFVVNPGKYLAERDERMVSKVAGMVSNLVSNAMVVNDFKLQNPDLTRHEKLVQSFLRDEDPRLPLAQRMASAGKKAREYIASINPQVGQPARAPSADEYVPGPGGASGGYGSSAPVVPGVPTQEQMAAEERELYDYISERNSLHAAHFGDPAEIAKMQQTKGTPQR